jgi:hypothetical protein
VLNAIKLGSSAVHSSWIKFVEDGWNKNTEFGTIIYRTGSIEDPCYWYSEVVQGYVGLQKINIKKMLEKVPAGATPLISIHNHPNAGTAYILDDNMLTSQNKLLNVVVMEGDKNKSDYGNVMLFKNNINNELAPEASKIYNKLSPNDKTVPLFNLFK